MKYYLFADTPGLSEAEFIGLIKQTLQTGSQIMVNEEDITSADMVIAQLLKASNLKEALVGQNLAVTKVNISVGFT